MADDLTPLLTDAHRRTFDADGVVKIAGAVTEARRAPLLEVVERELAAPGPWVTDSNPGAIEDRLFTTRYLWQDDPAVRAFVFESGVAGLVGELLGASSMRFYFDHLLVKEPGTTAPTPWHQDIPYWPFLGRKIGSAWVALTSATVEASSLEFIRASHRWDTYYAPEPFDASVGWTADFEGDRIPDIDGDRSGYDIVGFDVEPGDVLVFSAWVIHGAPGNAGGDRRVAFSTRWLGDDATWSPHPGCDPTVGQEHVSIDPGAYPDDDDRFPLVWERVGA